MINKHEEELREDAMEVRQQLEQPQDDLEAMGNLIMTSKMPQFNVSFGEIKLNL